MLFAKINHAQQQRRAASAPSGGNDGPPGLFSGGSDGTGGLSLYNGPGPPRAVKHP
jgi:hypothetical protein